MDWNDLKAFLAVAEQGSLSAAARKQGGSSATLGRRIAALESLAGRQLIRRRREGCSVTSQGQELLEIASEWTRSASRVEAWLYDKPEGRQVRITAGSWMTFVLANNVGRLTDPRNEVRLFFGSEESRADLARRAAEIGIRNERPEHPWLAARALGRVAFAIYAHKGLDTQSWLVTSQKTPSAEWTRRHHGERIKIEVSSPRNLLDLVLAGAGRAVLPCIVGDREPALHRSGGPIDELEHRQWLVAHHDDRHDPRIRGVISRLVYLIRDLQPGLRGARSIQALNPS